MAKKKKVRVRRSKVAMEAPEETKPTLEIKASQLGGKDLDVDKNKDVEVIVTGRVMSESIERYGPNKGQKRYSLDVMKVRMA